MRNDKEDKGLSLKLALLSKLLDEHERVAGDCGDCGWSEVCELEFDGNPIRGASLVAEAVARAAKPEAKTKRREVTVVQTVEITSVFAGDECDGEFAKAAMEVAAEERTELAKVIKRQLGADNANILKTQVFYNGE